MFPELARFTDVALLLLRVMVGTVFVTSGWSHVCAIRKNGARALK
jgi:putative oxidoreductase